MPQGVFWFNPHINLEQKGKLVFWFCTRSQMGEEQNICCYIRTPVLWVEFGCAKYKPRRLCSFLFLLSCSFWGSLKCYNKNVIFGSESHQRAGGSGWVPMLHGNCGVYHSGVIIQNKYYFKVRKQMLCWLEKKLDSFQKSKFTMDFCFMMYSRQRSGNSTTLITIHRALLPISLHMRNDLA